MIYQEHVAHMRKKRNVQEDLVGNLNHLENIGID